MAKEVAFGPNHLKAHHLRPIGAFSLASKAHQRKQSQDHVKRKGGKRERIRRRERALVRLAIHHHPSVFKAWLRSLIVEYVDEEERKDGSEGDGGKE